jgi:hypothetical protein
MEAEDDSSFSSATDIPLDDDQNSSSPSAPAPPDWVPSRSSTNKIEQNSSTPSSPAPPAWVPSKIEQNSSASSAPASSGSNNNNNDEPLRLPRIGGSHRGIFLRDTIQSQLPTNDQLQKRKQQAGRLFKNVGSQLSKINLSKLIDGMEQDQGYADSLEQLNDRMKEESERQGIRREAEGLMLKVVTDHLEEFLIKNPLGTYEDWIQDLHPENANQGLLFSDIQQIDERFYVQESDHRRLWNEAIEEQQQQQQQQQEEQNGDSNADNNNNYAHRLVAARTQIWGKAPPSTIASRTNSQSRSYNDSQQSTNPMIDLLSGSVDFQAASDKSTGNTTKMEHNGSNEQNVTEGGVSEDLIKF